MPMEKLTIKATKYTPEISLDPQGTLCIMGKSYPENTFEFYTPVIEWIEAYFQGQLASKTTIHMKIIYFNSSSSKLFFDFFDLLEEHISTHTIEINWIYDSENENVAEAGQDFIEDFPNLNINLITLIGEDYGEI